MATFFSGITRGWVQYYKGSTGQKFTEEQIRMADEAARGLAECHPVTDFLDPFTHSDICSALSREQYMKASNALEFATDVAPSPLSPKRAGCIEILKIGLYVLSMTSPDSIRGATFNLLACDKYFPTV